jgi:hypothetical protein
MPQSFGQGVEELRFKLTSTVCGNGLRATEVEYPAVQEVSCVNVSNVMSGMGMTSGQAGERVDCSEAVYVAC